MKTIKLLLICLVTAVLSLPLSAEVHDSVMWDYSRKIFLGEGAEYQFDARIKVVLPDFAEDSMQVPLMVDATGLDEPIEKIIAWADYNPIQHIFTFYPQTHLAPKLTLPFKVQQSTPVRAAVLTESGVWLVGSGFVNAAGGGCTLPSESRQTDDWHKSLGKISAGRFALGGSDQSERFKFKIMHPMDTGLVASIPSFYIEQVELRSLANEIQGRLELSPAVAENPVFTFDTQVEDVSLQLWLRDNDGNEFRRAM
jgi:sulfur-oxidizing protein SoxY